MGLKLRPLSLKFKLFIPKGWGRQSGGENGRPGRKREWEKVRTLKSFFLR